MAYIKGKEIVRRKYPEFDLRSRYPKVFWTSVGISCALHLIMAILFPTFDIRASAGKKDQIIIQMEEIPETRQIQRPPPPPRPAMPVETESDDVPDDVTIETTDLDLDQAPVDLPPPPPGATEAPMEEEVMEFWSVEEKPELIKGVNPKYPEIARKAGLEGNVFVKFMVRRDGRTDRVQVLRGQEIFRQAAMDAVRQFVFKPAIQNDKPVNVWMTQAIKFKLHD